MDEFDHDRILEIFHTGRTPTDEDWKRLDYYLSLADKLFVKAQEETDRPQPDRGKTHVLFSKEKR